MPVVHVVECMEGDLMMKSAGKDEKRAFVHQSSVTLVFKLIR
jgi:hypothetical protein